MIRLALALALLPVAAPQLAVAQPVTLDRFLAQPRPEPDARVSYGPAQTQGVDVFLPKGSGPHPVVLFIHGGCWDRNIPGREHVRALGPELAARGIAMWSIGYRRANEEGGGYPGTFLDVAAAVDRIRAEAPRLKLDLRRTVVAGHSAGGHLALWAAGRSQLPAASALRTADPFIPGAVVSLAGIAHLEKAERYFVRSCGPGLREAMVGPARPNPYADTGPETLRVSAPTVLVSGVYDPIVPPYAALDYAQAAAAARPELVNIPDSAHFDMVTVGTPAWAEVLRRLEAALAQQA